MKLKLAIYIGLSTALLLVTFGLAAHNLSQSNANFVESVQGHAYVAFMYLGAKHMVTGVDHLLFLLGVMFFLSKTRDVIIFATLFTLGHSITLLAGVLNQWQVDAYLIDAIIGLSIVYKAFENIQGFEKILPIKLNPYLAVFAFGLCHGLGLATKLQQFIPASDGLVGNIVNFNLGVEIGQILALVYVILALRFWQQFSSFQQQALRANTLIMCGGFMFMFFHLTGYFQHSL